MHSRFIEFNFFTMSSSGKTKVWEIISKVDDSVLGYIKWYANWRQYCFYPEGNTVFNKECLIDIHEFITQEMQRR